MKRVLCFSLLLVLGGSFSAYPSPTTKKITLDCSSIAPNVITGGATVSLCAASPLAACSGQTVLCGAISCDSSGAIAFPSNTISCDAPFKAAGVSFSETFADHDGTGAVIAAGGNSGASTLQKGRVGFTSVQASGSDSVTLTVK